MIALILLLLAAAAAEQDDDHDADAGPEIIPRVHDNCNPLRRGCNEAGVLSGQ